MKKFSERRAEIIKTARDLFQTKEYEKATMQDVMDRLKIAKGTIYHYFKSKEELLEAVIDDIIDESTRGMEAVVAKTKGNALQRLRKLMEAGSVAEENAAALEELHKPGNETMHTRLLAVAIRKQAPLYAKLFEQGHKEGIFKSRLPSLECAEFVLSAFQFLTDLGIYAWTPNDLKRRAAAFPKLIEQLLGAPAGSFRFLS